MPPDPAAIRFDPVRPAHYAMLRQWLEAPHIRDWWGDPETEFGYIRDTVEGRDTTRPYVIVCNDVSLGYIQCWFIGHHQNDEWIADHPWLAELPADAVGVDLSIGDGERLSQGIGSTALSAFIAKLVGEGHRTIVIDPDPENARAIRAYEKAGFRPIPHLAGHTRGVFLMQYDANAIEKDQ